MEAERMILDSIKRCMDELDTERERRDEMRKILLKIADATETEVIQRNDCVAEDWKLLAEAILEKANATKEYNTKAESVNLSNVLGSAPLTLSQLGIVVQEYITKNMYPPKSILITLPQLHELFKSGEELFKYMDLQTMTKFQDIPIAVEGSLTTLDLRKQGGASA